METENKSHEVDKNRDKNPSGPSTSGGKAWPDDKYLIFFLRISCDNNNILFPGNQAQFCLLWYQDFSSLFFLLFGELTTDLTPNLRQGQDPTLSPLLLLDLSNMKVHLGP